MYKAPTLFIVLGRLREQGVMQRGSAPLGTGGNPIKYIITKLVLISMTVLYFNFDLIELI